ncbi:MAG: DNA-directed RNA polymerase subunit omega [Synergistales bacterium]|nr:DNA-directed RNA polymerase subunit omega [Synergistales bacterium]
MIFYDYEQLYGDHNIENKYVLTIIVAKRSRQLSEQKGSHILEGSKETYITDALHDLEEGKLHVSMGPVDPPEREEPCPEESPAEEEPTPETAEPQAAEAAPETGEFQTEEAAPTEESGDVPAAEEIFEGEPEEKRNGDESDGMES